MNGALSGRCNARRLAADCKISTYTKHKGPGTTSFHRGQKPKFHSGPKERDTNWWPQPYRLRFPRSRNLNACFSRTCGKQHKERASLRMGMLPRGEFKRDSSTNLPGSTNRRPGSPILYPGASRKTKGAGHFARNDGVNRKAPA